EHLEDFVVDRLVISARNLHIRLTKFFHISARIKSEPEAPGHLPLDRRIIFERARQEILYQHDQAAMIPGAKANEGIEDRLDISPAALVLDRVADVDRLREHDLQAGEDIAEDRLRRDTENHGQ